jgi:hypothetical protein
MNQPNAETLLEVWPSTTAGVIALLLLHVGELAPPHLPRRYVMPRAL